MKRLPCLIMSIVFATFLTACSKEETSSDSTSEPTSSTEPENDSLAQNVSSYVDEDGNTVIIFGPSYVPPTFEEVQAEYPDKTVLVWAMQYMGAVPVEEINKYLDDNGYDLAVCFKPIHVDYENYRRFPDACVEDTKELLDSGEQIDIISPMNYEDYVFGGMYEPLDDYFETDLGKKLYGIMPTGHWESLRINGRIYGVHGPSGYTLTPDWGYFVNAGLAEKYGFDVSKPIDEQIDILKKVKQNEPGCDIFSMSLSRTQIPILNVGLKEISIGAVSVYWNDETHSAECAFDNAEYLQRLRLYDALKGEGLFKNDRYSTSKNNFFIMQENIEGAGTVYNTSDRVTVNYNGNEIEAIPVYDSPTYIRKCGVATGVCSYSDSKEKAFRLLALTQTDAYLNNLLSFGIEGEDYELENGAIKEVSVDYSFNKLYFANHMICLPYEEFWFTPEQYEEIYANAGTFGDSGFVVDLAPIAAELNVTEPVFDDLYFRTQKDGVELSFEETISALRKRLEDAGIQKIIDECNRQYEVYKNENN